MAAKKKHIVCFHLFNNYTGSPKVLSQVIKGLIDKGYRVDLVTNKTEGFLSNIKGVNYKYIYYSWNKNKLITLLYFIWAQVHLFIISFFEYKKSKSIFYINTLLPFGAAIAGKILKKEVIYHVHEHYLTNGLLYSIYSFTFIKCANRVIFVSNYISNNYNIKIDSIVIYNSLDLEYEIKAEEYLKKRDKKQETILMISSLKTYKGIYQLIKLSDLTPHISFELVLSCTPKELDLFSKSNRIPSNLKVYSCQKDLHKFYQRSIICLNLSLPNMCVETFGLTILEAMTYGIPVIIPPVGGPIELVDDGFNGFHVDSRDLILLKKRIDSLLENNELYMEFSERALIKSKEFNYKDMINKVENFLTK